MTPGLLSSRLGRGDVRRRAAVPARGSLGAARRAARGGAEHLPADALAGRNTARLQAVPGARSCGAFVAEAAAPASTSSASSTRSTTSPGCVRRSTRCSRPAARRRGGDVLHRRPARPGGGSLHARLLPRLAERIVETGAHILAIKDMAGLLRAGAADKLVGALRDAISGHPHPRTHPRHRPAGSSRRSWRLRSRGDAVDAASAPMAGTTSQPSLSALVAATASTDVRHWTVADGRE